MSSERLPNAKRRGIRSRLIQKFTRWLLFGFLLTSVIPLASSAISRSRSVDSDTSDIQTPETQVTVTPVTQQYRPTTATLKVTTTTPSPTTTLGPTGTVKVATITPVPPTASSPQAKQDKMGFLLENPATATAGDGSLTMLMGRPTGPNVLSPPTQFSNGNDEDSEEALNETMRERDALQEEGTHHQPVVFIGGPGYIPPPGSLRPRPSLESDLPWPPIRPELLSGSSSSSGTSGLMGSGGSSSSGSGGGSGGSQFPQTRFPYPIHSPWDRNYRNPFNVTRVQHIEAECQDDFMKLRVSFNGSFQGLIYSSGFAYDNDCVYVNGTGRDYYEYLIRLNRCGTLGASNHAEGRKEPSKNFMWNTVTVQYNPMIEEEWDEHFKVTCEYGYDFWKTVTFKPFDVEVATGNPVLFTLSPPECYMEVRYGFGATGTRVGGPVRVGDPLTLMIYMRSQFDGFDLVVNDCYAHNGGTKRIQLIDHYGCPVDSKLMSPFRGTWSHTTVYETQVYAYLKTFRFTGSPALYIECDVRMCHGQCPSQPCYWRNVKNIQKRSVDTTGGADTVGDANSTMSESINLSQALTVLQDQEEEAMTSLKTEAPDTVCLKSTNFTALFGIGTVLLATLAMVSIVSCFRLRKVKDISDDTSSSTIIRPYSHPHHHRHQGQHQPITATSNSPPPRRSWASSSSSLATNKSIGS